ncbi:RDD family protein [Ancylobacter dichloromethanicus]|uniref:RDD family protein n=1 Tax=Ancylobacter dichloromethanicus TaxID=518825 RepID=A0A9W6MZ50_9HYPH|nr:RDD family protein [Ancylobacter dichloromethanicus]MBS7554520.1 RDD family protein [Ancylobacter dichloromethanicus]GLK71650.1 RDD family protein [Ancylobacter dichloromethanicus]
MFDTRNGDEARPYAFDPLVEPEYFRGVLFRRFLAFLIDAVMICVPVGAAALLIFVFGFLTLGLGWFLFGLLGPGFVVWALVYTGLTLGGPRSATIGMRAMGIEMRLWYGAPMTPLLAVVSLVLFWVSMSVFTPLVAVVGLLNRRKRLVHDFVVGTVVTNDEARADELRRYR